MPSPGKTKEKKTALVVGAGPAGGLLAFLLARAGIPVTLVERHTDFTRVFRGEGLMPSGQDMFRQAGLWPQFDALPHSQFRNVEIFYKKKRILEQSFSFGDGILAPRFVSQPHMLDMLVSECEKYDNFTFVRGLRVTGPFFDGKRVAGVEAKSPDGPQTIRADYVFATDGRYSALRKMAGLDSPQNPDSFDIVWYKLPMPDFMDRDRVVRAYFGNGHLGLFIPSYDLLQIGWVIRKGAYKDFRAMGIDGWITEMAALVSDDMAQHLRQHRQDITHPFLLDVVSDFYEDWSVPGLCLLGDAAHPMSPVGGQGINIALRDAVVAANHFIPLLRSGAPGEGLDGAASAFAAERSPEVREIQALQRRPPRFLLGQGLWLDSLVLLARAVQKTGIGTLPGRKTRLENTPFFRGIADVRLKDTGQASQTGSSPDRPETMHSIP